MKGFTIQTLIDITETKQYRREFNKEIEWAQQQNFQMLIQSIGMRVNPLYTESPYCETTEISLLNFGTNFKGTHKVWSFSFEIEYEDGFHDQESSAGLLIPLLNFVPCIIQLTESANISPAVFNTVSTSTKNTIVKF